MNDLHKIIVGMIRDNGPMDIGTYMNLCLGHPQHGYYMTRDPFGAAGDFTTAPEISQMFGEMIGAWLADLWLRMGSPKVSLLEAGPGRGTLMADILRSTRRIAGFHKALDVHFLEISPVLKDRQRQALAPFDIDISWHAALAEVSGQHPVFCIANEFLDALPVRQWQHAGDGWHERMIDADASGKLYFGLGPVVQNFEHADDAQDFIEYSSACRQWTGDLASLIRDRGGAALIVDYGYERPSYGDTLQAVKNHAYTGILDDPGQADLTAHVNFSSLKTIAENAGCKVYGPVGQGAFLRALGIEARAARLGGRQDELERLTLDDRMGALFKVMAITSSAMPQPEGFA